LVGVGRGLPGGELRVERAEVVDAPVEALLGQAGRLDLGDVEPGAVFGSVMDLQSAGQGVGFGWWERFVQ
jgi:hypothetical protein